MAAAEVVLIANCIPNDQWSLLTLGAVIATFITPTMRRGGEMFKASIPANISLQGVFQSF